MLGPRLRSMLLLDPAGRHVGCINVKLLRVCETLDTHGVLPVRIEYSVPPYALLIQYGMVLILRKAAATYHTREVRVEHPKDKLECGVPHR